MKALQHRRVDVPEWCPLCHHEPEDAFHVLVSCPSARNVWCLTSIGSHIGSVGTFIGWWNNLVISREPFDIEVAAVVLWSIWQNRNEVVWNGKCRPVPLIFSSAVDIRTQWSIAHQKLAQPHLIIRQQTTLRWNKPPEVFVKCNVDAAIFGDPPRIGYGCLLRNSLGTVITAIHGSIPGIQNPTEAEALGIREALSWLKVLNMSNIIIESDAKLVVDALNFPTSDSSSLGLIVEDCLFLTVGIQFCFFVFVNRSANQAAHTLTRAIGSMSGFEDRITPLPSLISNVILSDSV